MSGWVRPTVVTFHDTLRIENPRPASLELFPEEASSSGTSSCRRRWPSGDDLGLRSDVVDDIAEEVVGVGVQLRGLQLVDLDEDEQDGDPDEEGGEREQVLGPTWDQATHLKKI